MPLTPPERAEERALLERLRGDASALAGYFALEIRTLEAENPRVRRRYGICYDDGTIRIRLRHAKTGRLLKYSFLVDTLCHELAHLRYFNHGPRFKAFYLRILERARRERIYAPTLRIARPARVLPEAARAPSLLDVERSWVRRPVQLELF